MDPNKASKTELRRGKIISWQWTQIKLSLVWCPWLNFISFGKHTILAFGHYVTLGIFSIQETEWRWVWCKMSST
jgi:hypothetical protein